jgi:hypothetical protein
MVVKLPGISRTGISRTDLQQHDLGVPAAAAVDRMPAAAGH